MARKALNPITAATIIVIMYMIMPALSVVISTYITTYAYMLLVVFLVGFIALSGGVRRINNMIYLLLPFAIYIILTYFTKGDSLLLWGYQSLLFLLPVIVGYYYLYYKPENTSLLTVFVVLSLIVTVITTIIGLIRFPNAARILATIAESDDPENIKYGWHNIGGYTFVYTAVLLYPILILSYKLKKINAIVFWISVIALFALTILSEYTTALILIMLTSILYFVGKKTSSKQLMIIGVLVFLALFFLWPVISDFLLWLADILNSETLAERLTSLANGYTGLENSESNRIELYRKSIESFLSSPFFGRILGNYTSSGGHSFILDTLADYGIVGGVTLILIYRNVYRIFFSPFKNEYSFGFVLWAFVQSIILSAVNTGLWLNVLAFFIPIILSAIYNINREDTYESSLDS